MNAETSGPLPNRIRELRDARHWSLRELAEHTRINHNKLHRLELGTTPLNFDDARSIADSFSVPISALLNEEDVEFRPDEMSSALLQEMRGVLPEQRGDLLAAAKLIVRLARGLAASETMLAGDRNEVAQLAETWNAFRPEERAEALQLWRISRIGQRA